MMFIIKACRLADFVYRNFGNIQMKALSEISATRSSSFLSVSMIFMFIFLQIETNALSFSGNQTFPAIYVFGDSIVDTGNNNYINTLVKCNFKPYGKDFNGGRPSGRFSNGKVPSDLYAQELGIKELVPPYLDPNVGAEDFLTGVSFASGAAGYDPLTSNSAAVISLSDQLSMFRNVTEQLKAAIGENRTAHIVASSLFMLVASSNDISNTFYLSPFRNIQYDIDNYSDFLLNHTSAFVQELYSLGARRIAISNAPPLGCIPILRTIYGGPERKCVESVNRASMTFNKKLKNQMMNLQQQLPEINLAELDAYTPIFDVIQNFEQYGFKLVDRGCCGTGFLEASILCSEFEPTTCANVSDYVFWDSYHPTEKSYRILVSKSVDSIRQQFFKGKTR